jgi:hypothetical protein
MEHRQLEYLVTLADERHFTPLVLLVPHDAPEWIVSTLVGTAAPLAPRLLEILDEERAEAAAA